ncbi:MAG: LacI family DNA-binding transcriptional regulator [Opitutaceae bacterium]
MQKPVTLSDVAKAAGVALGTASRVLNNFTDVDPETRQRVLRTVDRLHYTPLRVRKTNGARRSAVRSSPNIGLILLGMDDSLVHVPVLTEILLGVDSAVSALNGNLMLANLPDASRVPAFLRNNQVEGLIVKISQYSELPDPEKHPLIRNILRFPLVWVWGKPAGAPGDLCSFNHETAAQIAADHLRAKGHRRVAYLNPKKGKSSLEHLKKEFRFACEVRGLEFRALESASDRIATWPEPALTSADELRPLVDQWRELPAPERPTAVFVPADNIAIHLYGALESVGLRIPEDLSIISCNYERALIPSFKPTLTTMNVSASQIGAKGVAQLLGRLDHTGDQPEQTLLLEPTLVPGSSVAQL